nr:MAG TPA: hypothetical protein [Bacteriophage sp.]
MYKYQVQNPQYQLQYIYLYFLKHVWSHHNQKSNSLASQLLYY